MLSCEGGDSSECSRSAHEGVEGGVGELGGVELQSGDLGRARHRAHPQDEANIVISSGGDVAEGESEVGERGDAPCHEEGLSDGLHLPKRVEGWDEGEQAET